MPTPYPTMARLQREVDLFEIRQGELPRRIRTTFDLRNAYIEELNARDPGAIPFAVEDARRNGELGLELAFNGLPVCPEADLPADTVIVE